jgi:glycosyltransferase involved in cell wall biosynthesis
MHRWLRRELASGGVDIVHNNGLWMMPNIYPGWVTRGSGAALVVSPRGTFSRFAMNRSRHVKKLFWHSLQKRALANTALFHATADHEYADIRRMGFRQPVAVIPNGIDLPDGAPAARPPSATRTLLFLSRVHPTKGVDHLLQAWAGVQSDHPDWNLRIVGPGDTAYVEQLQTLGARLGVQRVAFDGPLYGADKWAAYRGADLFVLPTHTENFGMAIAEALAAGCPVITTRGAPWPGLAGTGAGWWIDIGANPLRAALTEAMAQPAGKLAQMGARGRAWMERDFAWDQIAAKMLESYRWAREGGTRPVWIHCD